MPKLRQEILLGCLSALLLSSCAPREPIPPKLASPEASRAADNGDDSDTADDKKRQHGKHKKQALGAALEYQTAVNDCSDLATKQTAGSLLTFLTRLRPGAYTASYVACMKTKGYDVSH